MKKIPRGRNMVGMNSKNRRLTPSLIISILALFVAIGGTSYAAVKINGKDIKKGTVAGKALKKNTVTGAKIKESSLAKVPSAKVADSAATAGTSTTAINADNAANAANAANADKLGGKTAAELASPAAFALINDGAVPAGEARGITTANVTEQGSGFVCISGLPFDAKHAQVTTYRVGGSTTDSIPNVNVGEMNFCPETAQAEVQLVQSGGAPDNNPRFYISLYR